MTKLGTPMRRLEDGPLVVGAGAFIADLIDDETIHAVFVRSPVAHGTFAPPSLDEALAMPGVVAAFRADSLDLPDLPSSPGRGAPDAIGMGQPALARQRVRHVGEPVAVVVAETAREAFDAVESIWVDYEILPAVTDVSKALENKTLLFPEVGTNLVHEETTGSGGITPTYQRVADVSIEIPRLSPVTIEPLTILVKPNGSGLDVWCGHQS
ncbi:MAG TPA: xanthine dehydrogenase family protein molybdopterin-binding subunit, partial [Acidimicrobiia bacterium]|nr:xanthine dehydrogenase family protein molybdopterin-binding subunit [Acidimicrobiia bacterium]